MDAVVVKCMHPECNKKLSLTDNVAGKCKCGSTFCKKHRDGVAHNCVHDHFGRQKEFLTSNLPMVKATKVNMI